MNRLMTETQRPTPEVTLLPHERPLLTPREVAKILDKSLTQTYEAIHRGELPSVKIGSIYVPRLALEHLLAHGRLPECSAEHLQLAA